MRRNRMAIADRLFAGRQAEPVCRTDFKKILLIFYCLPIWAYCKYIVRLGTLWLSQSETRLGTEHHVNL